MCFPRITKVLSVSRRRRNKAKQEEKKKKKSKAVGWIEQSTDRARNQQTNQSTERHVGSRGRDFKKKKHNCDIYVLQEAVIAGEAFHSL